MSISSRTTLFVIRFETACVKPVGCSSFDRGCAGQSALTVTVGRDQNHRLDTTEFSEKTRITQHQHDYDNETCNMQSCDFLSILARQTVK